MVKTLSITAAAILVPVLLVGLLFAGVWRWSESHALMPGIDGCSYVRDFPDRVSCLTKRVAELEQKQGLSTAIATLEKVSKTRANIATDCHLALHPIGMKAAKKAKDGASSPVVGTTWCTEGYEHGFLIGVTSGREFSAAAAMKLLVSCSERDGKRQLTCTHAMGHAFVRQTHDMRTATKACAEFEAAQKSSAGIGDMVMDCVRGAMMEGAMRNISPTKAHPNTCLTIDSRLLSECYFQLPASPALQGGNYADSARTCTRTAPAKFRKTCATGFGYGSKGEHCDLLKVETLSAACTAGGSIATGNKPIMSLGTPS